MKILIKEHKAHIKDYGFTTDVGGNTRYGVNKELIDLLEKQGGIFSTKFIEDKSLPHYMVGFLNIPRGQLNIYVEFNNNLVAPPQGKNL